MQEIKIKESIEEIVALALSGKGIEAWEKFYHESVEKIDLDGISIKGKNNVIASNNTLLGNITEVRTFEYVGSIVKGNRSFIVWHVDFDVKGTDTINAVEICINDWQDGQIVKERFFV